MVLGGIGVRLRTARPQDEEMACLQCSEIATRLCVEVRLSTAGEGLERRVVVAQGGVVQSCPPVLVHRLEACQRQRGAVFGNLRHLEVHTNGLIVAVDGAVCAFHQADDHAVTAGAGGVRDQRGEAGPVWGVDQRVCQAAMLLSLRKRHGRRQSIPC